MTTLLVVAFLGVHGLLHLAIWLPKPAPDPAGPPPFEPDHSGVLTAVHVPQRTTRTLAIGLASATAAAYLLAADAVAIEASWANEVAVLAGVAGLVLKGLYFNPWLSLGVLLDVGVISSALVEWPVALV